MDYTNVKSACIIGAGVAGLAAASALRQAGVTCTVIDRNDRLGGVWTDGYLDYGLQVQKELYEFPGFAYPVGTPSFPRGETVQEYLTDYAESAGVLDLIVFNASVDDITRQSDGDGWLVTISKDGDVRQQVFDLVVVCVGLYSNIPYIPDLPGRDAFQGAVHHISDLKTADLLHGKRVAVVGFGKSATDAALAAKNHGAEAHIIVRKLHWPVPQRLAGVLPFKWGLLNRLTVTMSPPYKSQTALQKHVHTVGKPSVWLYWRSVELLLNVQFGLWSRFGTRQSLVPDEPAHIGAFNEATMVPRPEFYRAVRRNEIRFHKGTIERLTPDGAELNDGSKLDVDTIIFGTGWRSDYGFLSEGLQQAIGFEDDGIYLYRQMLHPDVPGLAFVGYASTVSNTLAYSAQAHWLAALVAGQHSLPDRDSQLDEIALMKDWKRSWMPHSHARAARLIVHLQHYLDELMTDLGHDPRRKSGPFAPLAEVFAPYQPSDYRHLAVVQRDES